MLFSAVVTDIRNANKAKKQPKFNRQLQTFLRRQVEGDCPIVARRALDTIVELYRTCTSSAASPVKWWMQERFAFGIAPDIGQSVFNALHNVHSLFHYFI